DRQGLAGIRRERVVGQDVDRVGARVLGHRRAVVDRMGVVVDRGDGDRERLVGTGVAAAVGGAAVIVDVDRDRGHAIGVGGRRVGQRAGRVDRRLGREEGVVVVGDDEVDELALLVGRAGAGVCLPIWGGL